MGATTKIQYLNPNGKTFNPWMGCSKVSPGCDHCFAERWAKRTGIVEWGPGNPRRRTSKSYWKQPIKWNNQAEKQGTRYRVLTDLCDVFDPEVCFEWKMEFFHLILHTPHLSWLVLTKRIREAVAYHKILNDTYNIWLGSTVCNQAEADRDIPILLNIPSAKHWISYEPALGPIDFHLYNLRPGESRETLNSTKLIDWIVCGGESGPCARPMQIEWARGVMLQCKAAGVPFFMKQLSGFKNNNFNVFDSFPNDLKIRQYLNEN